MTTRLKIHTLATLLDELVSGRAVLIDDGGREFSLTSVETRSILDWYRQHRDKWARNVLKTDVEEIVDQLSKSPPELPALGIGEQGTRNQTVHLKDMRVHRFAGIHPHRTPDAPPDEFHFEFGKPLTLIEGKNGAGKTSLLNAICWCLTGYVYRSQRPPETVDQPVDLSLDVAPTDDEIMAYDMTAITPMPSKDVINSLGDDPLPLDTWVELSFVDDDNAVKTIRRSVSRTARGKIEIEEPDFSSLGIPPIAREVGTTMPGLLPYITPGEVSDLGKAVSELTGLKPLQDLVKHARKTKAKLGSELVQDRGREIDALDADYRTARAELLQLIGNHPDIGLETPVPEPGPDKAIEETLSSYGQHFESLQAQAFAESQSILGESFDPQDSAARNDLLNSIGPAMVLLADDHLRGLSSAARLRHLGSMTDQEITEVEALLEKLRSQATELAQVVDEPDVAARLRLYTRVACWLKELPDAPTSVTACPVCRAELEGRVDQITGRPVAEHLQECLGRESAFLSQTIQAWEVSAIRDLKSELPEALQPEVSKDLPDRPADLISAALSEELFESESFKESLAPLKGAAETLCANTLTSLPPFSEPEIADLPDCFGDGIDQAIRRTTRVIAFANWRKSNAGACGEAAAKIIGPTVDADSAQLPDILAEERPLRDRLGALDRMVKNAEPLTSAIGKASTLTAKLKARRKLEDHIARYGKASAAIEPLFSLKDLAEIQVASLMTALAATTARWKSSFYVPAFAGAPRTADTDVETDGTLNINAAAQGVRASAQHIANASDLRATLLAFLLAFWEHLLETQGGLSLLLLDDLQELFDDRNRRRLANTVPAMLGVRGRIIATTNDTDFANSVVAAMAEADSADKVDRRCIHPFNPNREHIELGLHVEEIDRKLKAFDDPDNANMPQPAREYASKLRIYLEQRLSDLLDTPVVNLPAKPTLSDLIAAIRTRVNDGFDAFNSRVFRDLVSDSALANGSTFLGVMNDCHHGREQQITYTDVMEVKEDSVRVRKTVDAAHEEYERWLRRDPRDPPATIPAMPPTSALTSFSVPIIENLAAFTSEAPATEPLTAEDLFTNGQLSNHATYVINAHNFGFAGPCNCRAIVRLDVETVPDNSLVVALHGDKTYARRLLRATNVPETIVLGSDAENPLDRPPSLLLPTGEVRLLMVVGVLFDDRPHYSRQRGEAILVDDADFLGRLEVVFKVTGDSAIPLALPGQMILGGGCVTPDQLNEMEGRLIAVATSEGAAFKRVGAAVSGAPYLRQFESVGGLGESMLVRTEEVDGGFQDICLMLSARRVLGVLY